VHWVPGAQSKASATALPAQNGCKLQLYNKKQKLRVSSDKGKMDIENGSRQQGHRITCGKENCRQEQTKPEKNRNVHNVVQQYQPTVTEV
jgi:hypothetical protein